MQLGQEMAHPVQTMVILHPSLAATNPVGDTTHLSLSHPFADAESAKHAETIFYA